MWIRPPRHNTLHPRENGVVLLKHDLARVSMSLFLTDLSTYLSTPIKWRLPEHFIAQDQVVTMSHKAR
jgi:hypothetical protein